MWPQIFNLKSRFPWKIIGSLRKDTLSTKSENGSEKQCLHGDISPVKFEQPISSRLHNGVGSIEIDESPSGLRRRYFRNFPKEAGTTASLISIIPRSIYNPGVMAGLIIPSTASESNVPISPSIESLPTTLPPPP